MCVISGAAAILGTALFTAGSTAVTVGGALAGAAAITTTAIGVNSAVQSSRQSKKAQKAQAEAIRKLSEETGTTGVSKTTTTLQDNTSTKRTLSSLRVSLLPQTNTEEEVTQNAYGVDSNIVAASSQNMTGLNIAAA